MNLPIVNILFYLFLSFVISACDNAENPAGEISSEDDPSPKEESKDNPLNKKAAVFVLQESMLPSCDEQIKDKLFYVEVAGSFRVCVFDKEKDGYFFKEIDLQGVAGADGKSCSSRLSDRGIFIDCEGQDSVLVYKSNQMSPLLFGEWKSSCIIDTNGSSQSKNLLISLDTVTIKNHRFSDSNCEILLSVETQIFKGGSYQPEDERASESSELLADFFVDLTRSKAKLKYASLESLNEALTNKYWQRNDWILWKDFDVTDRKKTIEEKISYPLNENIYDRYRLDPNSQRLYVSSTGAKVEDQRPKAVTKEFYFEKSDSINESPWISSDLNFEINEGEDFIASLNLFDKEADDLNVDCEIFCPLGFMVISNQIFISGTLAGSYDFNLTISDSYGNKEIFLVGLKVARIFDVYEDKDGDGIGAGDLLKISAYQTDIPSGYSLIDTDCDDDNSAVWQQYGYLDQDGDGYTNNVSHCGGADASSMGYRISPNGNDCNDANGDVWQLLNYGFRDRDEDGYTVKANPGLVCSGYAPPSTYSLYENGNDCDDSNDKVWQVLFYHHRDMDLDGYAASDIPDHGTICSGESLPETYGESFPSLIDCNDSDENVWQNLAYSYRDEDGDGYTIAEQGSLCSGSSLPLGYSLEPNGNDCNDSDENVFQQYSFLDGDGDGYTIDSSPVCGGSTSPLAGYQLSSNGNDCDDQDEKIWQNLAYSYRDVDGDGYTIPDQGSLCTGSSLPVGYSLEPNGNDCNDNDENIFQKYGFLDSDGDGYTNTVSHCGGASASSMGYRLSPNGNDCDDANGDIWEIVYYSYLDADLDGKTVSSSGSLCTNGYLPPGYLISSNGDDCDDGDDKVWQMLDYIYEDIDNDGYTVSKSGSVCSGVSLSLQYPSVANGDDCNDSDENIFQQYSFLDSDGDGYTIDSSPVCGGSTSPLDGYKLSSNGNDCNDTDGSIWQNLAYSYRDVDGDGYTIAEQGSLCSGHSLPIGYSLVPNGNDCNDTDDKVWQMLNYSFEDLDFDGYTVSKSGYVCSGSHLSSRYPPEANGIDCNDNDENVWQQYEYFDEDGDGHTIEFSYCGGEEAQTLGYKLSSNGSDCNDGDPSIWSLMSYSHRDLGVIDNLDSISGTICTDGHLPEGYYNKGKVSSGFYHTCALATNGSIKCWGRNNLGQLGDGNGGGGFFNSVKSLIPMSVHGLSFAVVDISSGTDHTCALLDTGAVKCWGRNSSGQLGDGTTTSRLEPVQVSGLTSGVVGISSGGSHTCALIDTGAVKCWGGNIHGQLGDGNGGSYGDESLIPVQVLGLDSGVISVSSGRDYSCALIDSGDIKCWGRNNYGQLGDGSTIDRNIPILVNQNLEGVIDLSLSETHSCALLVTGAAYCWGDNYYGQLGDETTDGRYQPTVISYFDSDLIAIETSGFYETPNTCGLTSSGSVRCWGRNNYGQLGDGTTTDSLIPVEPLGLNQGVISLNSGYFHNCALLDTGTVKCWGDNDYGQLGDGTTTDRSIPVKVSTLDLDEKGVVDILLVVDNSYSMIEEQHKLTDKIGDLLLEISNFNWQLAITTTTASNSCSTTIVNKTDYNVEAAFENAISSLGINGSGDERGIFQARKGLECLNESGMIRSGSILAVMMVSDEDNCSDGNCGGTPDQNINYLTNYVENNLRREIGKEAGFYGIFAKNLQDCGSGYSIGNTYSSLLNYKGVNYSFSHDARFGSICDDSYSVVLSNISKQIKIQVDSSF